jgi:hypothetical protein
MIFDLCQEKGGQNEKGVCGIIGDFVIFKPYGRLFKRF